MEIKARVTARQAAECYGIEINRNKKALCVWHRERTPSLHFFENGTCHCFACGHGGSCIDLIMQVCSCTAKDAADILDVRFNLGLGSMKPDAAQIMKYQEDKALVSWFDGWLDFAVHTLTAYYRMLYDSKRGETPMNPDEEFRPLFIEALQNIDRIEYYLDTLLYGSPQDKLDFYKYNRKAVDRIAERLHAGTNTGSH